MRISLTTSYQLSMTALHQLFLPSLFPAISTSSTLISPLRNSSRFHQISRTMIAASLFIPLTTRSNVPSILAGLWESILRAVPKKKTSHRKKRQRFLAGKALQDVTALNKCSACGNVKRAHLLCPFCVEGKLQPCSGPTTGADEVLQRLGVSGGKNQDQEKRQLRPMHKRRGFESLRQHSVKQECIELVFQGPMNCPGL